MGHDSVSRGIDPDQVGHRSGLKRFAVPRRDLRGGWRRSGAAQTGVFLDETGINAPSGLG